MPFAPYIEAALSFELSSKLLLQKVYLFIAAVDLIQDIFQGWGFVLLFASETLLLTPKEEGNWGLIGCFS